jgi:hypothetical protein
VTEMDLTYVLPLRCEPDAHGDHDDLLEYLRWLVGLAEVIVVDGSAPDAFRDHRVEGAVHIAPDAHPIRLNGKVSGVLTGIRAASHERVVIADDDVRYGERDLRLIHSSLDDADLVVPQNVFEPMPWHACWDTSRTLINRAFGTDYGGTLALRRSTLLRVGGYDGDVLFENLELMRTVRASGARVRVAREIIVDRRPPTLETFLGQRVRQAFDDLAQPARLATFLSIGPALALAAKRRRGTEALLTIAGLSIALAEFGRRRSNGTSRYPAVASLMAPIWLAERSVCIWLALARRFMLGGINYRGTRISTAAHSMGSLRRHALEREPLGVTLG